MLEIDTAWRARTPEPLVSSMGAKLVGTPSVTLTPTRSVTVFEVPLPFSTKSNEPPTYSVFPLRASAATVPSTPIAAEWIHPGVTAPVVGSSEARLDSSLPSTPSKLPPANSCVLFMASASTLPCRAGANVVSTWLELVTWARSAWATPPM